MNKCACKLLRDSKIFSPPLSPTLAKPHNEVSPYESWSNQLLTFMMLRGILFDRCPKWLVITKKYTCMLYVPNGYLNTVSNFNFRKFKKSAFLRTSFDQP